MSHLQNNKYIASKLWTFQLQTDELLIPKSNICKILHQMLTRELKTL